MLTKPYQIIIIIRTQHIDVSISLEIFPFVNIHCKPDGQKEWTNIGENGGNKKSRDVLTE